jgi:hypothetical protein
MSQHGTPPNDRYPLHAIQGRFHRMVQKQLDIEDENDNPSVEK